MPASLPVPQRTDFLKAALLLAIALPTTSSAQAPATMAAGPAASFRRASCVIRVELDSERPVAPGPIVRTVEAALTSSALLDPVMQSVLSLKPDVWPSVVQIEIQPIGDVAINVIVNAKSSDSITLSDTAAADVLAALTKALLSSYDAGTGNADEKRDALIAQRRDLDQQIARTQAMLNSRSIARSAPGGDAMNRAMLERQRDSLASEQEVQTSLLRAIEEQIAELKDETPESVQLRSKLISQRVDAKLSIVRAEAQRTQVDKRIAELSPTTTQSSTTAPADDPVALSAELASLTAQRADLEQSLRDAAAARPPRNAKPRLVAITGQPR